MIAAIYRIIVAVYNLATPENIAFMHRLADDAVSLSVLFENMKAGNSIDPLQK